ncbi:MAG: GNAT family N-acetyltransferase [Chloroflexota bacterium]|nr:GNAT family N-acetyltransferase [Chloroflexota bacterium]
MVQQLLDVTPDLPRWVELRSLLLAGSAVVHGQPGGYVVRGTGWRAGLLVAVGEPPIHVIREAARSSPGANLLAVPESHRHIAAMLGRPGVRARILRLREERLPADLSGVRFLSAADGCLLERVPDPLRDELLLALRHVPIAAAFVDGRPVSFCYPSSITETLWDVSIDTLEPFRRRGLAGLAVAAMTAHMRRLGREPVWGAADDNPSSLALARKLGFEVVDHLFVFSSLEDQ